MGYRRFIINVNLISFKKIFRIRIIKLIYIEDITIHKL